MILGLYKSNLRFHPPLPPFAFLLASLLIGVANIHPRKLNKLIKWVKNVGAFPLRYQIIYYTIWSGSDVNIHEGCTCGDIGDVSKFQNGQSSTMACWADNAGMPRFIDSYAHCAMRWNSTTPNYIKNMIIIVGICIVWPTTYTNTHENNVQRYLHLNLQPITMFSFSTSTCGKVSTESYWKCESKEHNLTSQVQELKEITSKVNINT